MPLVRTERGAELEREYVEAMVDLLELQLRSAPSKCEPPAADFALDLDDGRRVAVEVTEAIDPNAQEAWHGIRERLETRIRDLLAERSVSAEIMLTTHTELLFGLRTRRDVNGAAGRLVDLVCERLPRGLPSWNARKIPGLEFLRTIKIDAGARTRIITAVSGPPPRGADQLQLAIDSKSAKLPRYRSVPADAYWLLVVGGQPLSGYVTIGDARSRTFYSAFDETLFLDDGENEIAGLATVTPEPDL